MTMQETDTSVQRSIVVEAPIERAFTVFTEDIGSWWPPDYHLLEAELAEMVFEPREGGRIYDRGVDGSESHWARVIAYEPPNRLVIGWNISPRWDIETDFAKTSEVEVRFVSEAPDRTRVEVEHRNLDRHGEGWENLARPGGWASILQAFAKRLGD
jgi:uncharacterized protein YndB with AHSA1/START domain